MLRALIVQLCEYQQHLFQILPSEYERDSDHFFSSSFDILCYTLEKMLREGTYARVYCVIDGLDVYREGMKEFITRLAEFFNLRTEVKVRSLNCCVRLDQKGLYWNCWIRQSMQFFAAVHTILTPLSIPRSDL